MSVISFKMYAELKMDSSEISPASIPDRYDALRSKISPASIDHRYDALMALRAAVAHLRRAEEKQATYFGPIMIEQADLLADRLYFDTCYTLKQEPPSVEGDYAEESK